MTISGIRSGSIGLVRWSRNPNYNARSMSAGMAAAAWKPYLRVVAWRPSMFELRRWGHNGS